MLCSTFQVLRRRINYYPLTRAFSSSSSPEPFVLIKKDELNGKPTGVVIVSLNRPKTLNALTVEVGNQFQAAVAQISADKEVRAVVLTGEGKAFSAGGDLEFLKARSESAGLWNSEEMRRFYHRFLSVRALPVPVISAINGPAIGAGLCLALATDIRITHTNSKMGVTFVSLGLHPGMGATHFLPKLIGPQLASRLLLTVGGIGLVERAVEKEEEVVPAAIALARKIADQSSVAVRTCVRSIRNQYEDQVERALWREADAQAHCYASADITEGLNAIREKRSPNFNPNTSPLK